MSVKGAFARPARAWFMDPAGGRVHPAQPASRPEVFTPGVIYITQVFFRETSRLRADTVIALELQTSAFFCSERSGGQRDFLKTESPGPKWFVSWGFHTGGPRDI